MGATSATTEWSFSTIRRITWLQSSMKRKIFNSLAIQATLNFHKDMTDKINFVETGNTFVSSHENRLNQFGKFTSNNEL